MLGLSTTYHLFYCCSSTHYVRLQNADYAGIAIMIASNTTPPFYYGFMCSDKLFWRCLWLGQVYLCCLIALCVTLAPTKRISWLNSLCFILAGYSTVPGIVHLGYNFDD